MLEVPEALGAEAVALQGRWTSAHLACFGTGLGGTLRRDEKDSKELKLLLGIHG